MENLFTRREIISFKIAGLIIAFVATCVPILLFLWGRKETKKLEERLKEEIIARKDSENKTAKENAERWNSLYQQEKESREGHCKWIGELEKEIYDLRNQLSEFGLPQDEHDISDRRRKRDATQAVKAYWKAHQNKNEKINGRTITEVLGEKNVLKDKEGRRIIETRDWLIRKIDDELELSKK